MGIWWAKPNPCTMNKLTHYLPKIAVLLLVWLTSCATITEEIYLNSDGSGEYMVYSDVISSTREMMVGMMGAMYPEASTDSLMQIIDNEIWENFPAVVDSIIDFSSRVPDSIRNDPDKNKYIEKMEMFMKGSRKEQMVNSGIRFRFDAIEELQGFQDFMRENQASTGGAGGMELPDVEVTYSFDGNVFSRTSAPISRTELGDSTMMMLNVLLEKSQNTLILHMPNEVKKASDAQLVEVKGKDVIYQFELLKVLNGEQTSDVKVEF